MPGPYTDPTEKMLADHRARRIVTDYLYPGWRAYDADSYDGATDSPDPTMGYGATEAEAVADLLEQEEDK